ncbi:MAG: amidase [Syntrophobacteraceae bacterium]|jgi:amidase
MSESAVTFSVEESGGFVELLAIGPYKPGKLDGLRFAVKDLIDLGGCKTSCGNPDWGKTHPVAAANAVCVDQLLDAGAFCVGKTVSDELAFSLHGENYFYGTPLNPRAVERVPGGSSSGSASAVACGLADFALGTDTGGSVRVPASNCGIFGMRPSHGAISVAGVMPFAPSFDTVGILASSLDVLTRAASVLLAADLPDGSSIGDIHILSEALEIADPEVKAGLVVPVDRLRNLFPGKVRETSIREIDGESAAKGLDAWCETYCVIQWAEIWNSLGSWIDEAKPAFGPRTKVSFELTKNLDRSKIGDAVRRRERYSRRMEGFLGPEDLLLLPTSPILAPLKDSAGIDRSDRSGTAYYPRTLSLTAIAGIGRLPQISLPVVEIGGVPMGLSLLAPRGRDAFLLRAAQTIYSRLEGGHH